ncbi:MAG TPA: hypothetical protein VGH94_10010, partial [Acidimicrobiales bacterium]
GPAHRLGTDSAPTVGRWLRRCLWERQEEWNHAEALGSTTHPKRVFGPPDGGRSVNIQVREAHGETARYALLVRDFLGADSDHRDATGWQP